jgi:hypothetical protein
MKEKRLQMVILSPSFYIPITLVALMRGLLRSTCFRVNSIVSRFVFVTSGIMIVFYARKLNLMEGNNHRSILKRV